MRYAVPQAVQGCSIGNYTTRCWAEVGHYVGSGTKQPVFDANVNDFGISNVIAMTAVAVSDGTTVSSGEPFTRDDCEPGDGLTVRFLRDSFEGLAGDVKKLSASVAASALRTGTANLFIKRKARICS